ncbi:unnamed protein product [Candidula unifasciata]|uniref:THO complex subunit 6 n=1 Tax=Candidula unifasciata TaxID=100452 RepID=A0A8S3Z3C9_9EUPU|nr:unnamed protein product [Candidula unifasciata]
MLPKDSREALQYMLHTIVFDTSFSPCGRYLAAANKFGDVALFSLTAALAPDVRDEAKYPVFTFNVYKNGGVYSLTSTDTLLICAGEGDIQAYKWSDIISKNARVAWSLAIPKKGVFSHPEVNSCVVYEDNDSLTGHTDYIHSVALKDEGKGLISAAEDGTARIWDLRAKEAVHVVKPFEHEMCTRPHMGKWLQCLAMDEENYWLLLGGGPTLAAWHLKTLTPAVTFDTPGVAQNVTMFYEDKIFSAGSSNVLNHWSITGEHKMGVPVSPVSVYSIGINSASKSNKVMVVAGSCEKLDVCTNFGYRAFSLTFLPPLA